MVKEVESWCCCALFILQEKPARAHTMSFCILYLSNSISILSDYPLFNKPITYLVYDSDRADTSVYDIDTALLLLNLKVSELDFKLYCPSD